MTSELFGQCYQNDGGPDFPCPLFAEEGGGLGDTEDLSGELW